MILFLSIEDEINKTVFPLFPVERRKMSSILLIDVTQTKRLHIK